MRRLQGKRVWITAAAAGIGRACAIRCAEEGADVHASDVDGDRLDTLPPEIRRYHIDSTDPAAVQDAALEIGPVDGVIHCVGYVHQGTLLDCPLDAWRRSFEINVHSFYMLATAILPSMIAEGGGSLVCIASVASSLKGLPARAAYGASKAALIGMTKSLAIDYAGHGVRANAVCPGTVLSPSLISRAGAMAASADGRDEVLARFAARQPMGRLGEPDEIAALCAYLLSDESRFVTGQAWAIDGGITI